MFDHDLTRHAAVRLRQRNFRREDIEEVLGLRCGLNNCDAVLRRSPRPTLG